MTEFSVIAILRAIFQKVDFEQLACSPLTLYKANGSWCQCNHFLKLSIQFFTAQVFDSCKTISLKEAASILWKLLYRDPLRP